MAALCVLFVCSSDVMLVILLFIPLVFIVITFNLRISLDVPFLCPRRVFCLFRAWVGSFSVMWVLSIALLDWYALTSAWFGWLGLIWLFGCTPGCDTWLDWFTVLGGALLASGASFFVAFLTCVFLEYTSYL